MDLAFHYQIGLGHDCGGGISVTVGVPDIGILVGIMRGASLNSHIVQGSGMTQGRGRKRSAKQTGT